jgi:tetratricopeptide (TPR) repeat protein
MRKSLFPILIPLIIFACGKSLPDGARYISDTDTTFSADIRSISAKINLDPGNAENYYLRGNSFYFSNKFKDAIVDLNTAIAISPKNALYHLRIGESYLSLDSANYDGANKHLNEAVKLNPKYDEAIFLLAKLYVARQQYAEAEKLLNRIVDMPDYNEKVLILKSVALKEQKDTIKAIQIIDKVLVINPNNFDATMQKAMFILDKDPNMALKYIDKAIVLNEFSDEAIYTKGLLMQRLGNYKDAVKLYEKVNKINPFHVLAYYNRAVVESLFENYDDVVKYCDKCTELNPTFDKAYTLRGYAFMLKNKKDDALDNFNKALKLNPNSSITKEYLNQINK